MRMNDPLGDREAEAAAISLGQGILAPHKSSKYVPGGLRTRIRIGDSKFSRILTMMDREMNHSSRVVVFHRIVRKDQEQLPQTLPVASYFDRFALSKGDMHILGLGQNQGIRFENR